MHDRHRWFTCAFQARSLSMRTPRYLTELCLFNSVPSIDTWICSTFLSLLLFSTISCVLATFILRPFDVIHLEMLYRSFPIISLNLAGSLYHTYSMMSSAWSPIEQSCTKSGRSFMNSTNNSGPSILPCGTPFVTSFQSDSTPFITTRCLLLLR